jgi:alpha-tubulin suppressor-like RCC1 family protein
MSGKQITAAKSNSNANYVMALDSNGFVYSWGQNGDGKLGDGSTSDRHVPVSLYTAGTGLNGVRVTQIEPETNASFLLGANNKVYVMGGNGAGQFGDPSVPSLWQHQAWEPREMPFSGTPVNGKTVKSISGDGHHGLLVTTDGYVYSWGWNYFGQAGTGSRGPDTCEAANPCVRALTAVNVSGTLMNGRSITTIATGDRWSYAVATDGTAYAWGHDSGATSAATMESSRSVEYNGMLGIGPASAASGGTYLDNDTRWIYLKPKQMIFNPVIIAY